MPEIRPVIVNTCPMCEPIIEHEHNGLHYSPCDAHYDAFYEAMRAQIVPRRLPLANVERPWSPYDNAPKDKP